MNDSLLPLSPPPAKPFEPERLHGGGGCQKPVLVGCGLVALLLGVAAVIFVIKAKDVLAYAMNKLRVEVVAHLPEDAGEVDRQRVEAGFDVALARIRNGAIDPASLQELQKKLTAVASTAGSRRMTRTELTELITALDKFNEAGGGAPADAPPKAGAPDSTGPAGQEVSPDEKSRPPAP